jgi:hypothetical protein
MITNLLVLYRAIQAINYQPSPKLIMEPEKLAKVRPDVADAIHQAIKVSRRSPSH